MPQTTAIARDSDNGQTAATQVPRTGDLTKRQTAGRFATAGNIWSMLASACETAGLTPAPEGSYATYRAMRANPTLALARMAAMSPVKAAFTDASIESDPGAPAGAHDLIAEFMSDDTIRLTVRDMLRALDYGNQPFEIIWMNRGGRWIPRKIKPLLPDNTQVLIERGTGRFQGLRNLGVDLGITESLLFVYDMEADNWYGRSRNENIREHIWPKWLDMNKRMRQYAAKVAGIIPMVRYNNAAVEDSTGATVAPFDMAKKVLNDLSMGVGIAFPAELSPFADDLMKAGASIADIWSWSISFLEVNTAHGKDFIAMLREANTEIVRGWLVPERAITEGQFGTKAEAQAHAEFALLDAEDTSKDIAQCINWHLIDKVLALNFGEEARGTVRLAPAPLVDDKAAFVRDVVKAILANPNTLASVSAVLKLETMFSQAGVELRDPAAPIVIAPPPSPFGFGNPQEPAGFLPPGVNASLESNDLSAAVASIMNNSAKRLRGLAKENN